MADEQEISEDEDEITEDSSALSAALLKLKARCDSAKIDFIEKTNIDGHVYAAISFQSGRGKREVNIYSKEVAESFISLKFEKYRFLSGYEAIYCYEDKSIEVALRGTSLSGQYILGKILGRSSGDLKEDDLVKFSSSGISTGRPDIEIGRRTPEFSALSRQFSKITLKLKGVRANTHEQMLAELRAYADSLFLQIDLMFGSSFILERERRARPASLRKTSPDHALVYPIAHYNEQAMSLYWYARSAQDMPLLRFLAYYQAIEFYFPRYSQGEARKRVSAIIKNPTFRPYRDDDLDRLISAIQLGRSGGLGSERSQLRATVNECIGAVELRQYLVENDRRREHFWELSG
jgi:hypothetical protein